MNSRWSLSNSVLTCEVILVESSAVWSSRLRWTLTLRSRSATLTVSRLSWRCATERFSVVETTSARRLMSSMFRIASLSSSGRCGERSTSFWNCSTTLRARARVSMLSSRTLSSRETVGLQIRGWRR